MNGILIVDKPKDYTSRDVVNIVSKVVGTKKVGHTGTLDPIATGILVICIGSATKLVELLTSKEKEYIAEITLGIETDTLDITGNILKEEKVNVSVDEIDKTLESMIGFYDQEVPIYSAVKINGRKLYEYARNNEEVILPKRKVEIKELERISDVIYKDNKVIFSIKTTVSKGTYIRSLIKDISLKLNTIGVMSELRRTKQGIFNLNSSNTIDDIKNNNIKLLSIEDALKDIYTVEISDELAFKIKNGVQIKDYYNKDLVLFKNNNNIIALYQKDGDILKVYKML